jgi:hypothetical protein
MSRNLEAGRDYTHPKSVRMADEDRPKILGFEEEVAYFSGQHGQALEWALDKCHIPDKTASADMHYTNQAVISRWKKAAEHWHLGKLRAALGEEFFIEFLLALAATSDNADVSTSVTLRRKRSA